MSNPVRVVANGKTTDIWRFETPNHQAFSYVLPISTMKGRTVIFKDRREAAHVSGFAAGLLSMAGVYQVSMGSTEANDDFVTVTMKDSQGWARHERLVESTIAGFAERAERNSMFSLVNHAALPDDKGFKELVLAFQKAGSKPEEAVMQGVIEIANRKLASHGGETRFVRYDQPTHTLEVALDGNCTDCSSSQLTIQSGLMGQFKRLADQMGPYRVETVRIVPSKFQALAVK